MKLGLCAALLAAGGSLAASLGCGVAGDAADVVGTDGTDGTDGVALCTRVFPAAFAPRPYAPQSTQTLTARLDERGAVSLVARGHEFLVSSVLDAPSTTLWVAEGLDGAVLHRGAPALSERVERFDILANAAGAVSERITVALPRGVQAGVWTARARGEAVEIVDGAGVPTLRVHRPVAAGADGARRVGSIEVEGHVEGHIIEGHVAMHANGDGQANALGGRVLLLRARIDLTGLAPPIVLDPVFSSTGSLAIPRRAHSTTELLDGRVLFAGGRDAGTTDIAQAELFDPRTGVFSLGPSLETARTGPSVALLEDGRVLFAGGVSGAAVLGSSELFDPVTNRFVAGPSLPTPREGAPATRLPSGDVLLTGGRNGGTLFAQALLFQKSTGSFIATGNLAQPRIGHVPVRLPNGDVLVTGGIAGATVLTSAERYQASTGTFVAAGQLAAARFGHAAVALPGTGEVLALAGQNATTELKSAELWSPATASFTATGALATARRFVSAVALPDGTVVAIGGANGNTRLASTEVYTPGAGTWAAGPSLTTGRESYSATLLPSGKALVSGGFDGNNVLASVQLFDVQSAARTAAASLPTALSGAAGALLSSGELLVVGGSAGGAPRAAALLYDPVADSWRSTGSLATGRVGHTATPLPDGRVLVLGGDDGTGALASAEAYDPAAGSFSPAGTLDAARAEHTATLLPSGEVLVVGGRAGQPALTSVERFHPPTGASVSSTTLASGRVRHAAARLPSGDVVIAGGSDGSAVIGTVLRYRPASDTFTAEPSLLTARQRHTLSVTGNGGDLLVAGGDAGAAPFAAVERLAAGAAAWVGAGTLATARSEHRALTLPSGRVLVVGGRTGTGLALGLEAFDGATGRFGAVGALASGRTGPLVASLGDGAALIVGGAALPLGAGAPSAAVERVRETAANAVHVVAGPAALGAPGDVALLSGTGLAGGFERSDSSVADALTTKLLDPEGALVSAPLSLQGNSAASLVVPSLPPGNYRLWATLASATTGRVVVVAPRPPSGALPVSASPATLVADGTATTSIDVGPVLDASGAAVFDRTLLTVTSSAGTPLLVDAAPAIAGVQGEVLFGHMVFSLRAPATIGAAVINVAAVVGGATGQLTVPLVAGPPTGAVALVAAPAQLTADGADTATVAAGPLRDAFGNVVVDGTLVNVAATAGTLLGTDADAGAAGLQLATFSGRASFSLRAPVSAGSTTLTVSSRTGNASGTLVVEFIAGPATGAIPMTATPASLVADGVATTTIAAGPVLDAVGNLVVDGTRLALTASGGTLLATDLDPTTAPVDVALSAGRVSVPLRAPLVSGVVTVVGAAASAGGQVTVTVGAAPPSGAVALSISPSTVEAGGAAVAVSAAGLQNAAGTALQDGALFTVSSTRGTVLTADADPARPGVQVASSGGGLAFTIDGGSQAGNVTVDVVSVDGSARGSAELSVLAGPPDHAGLVPPSFAVAGAPAPLLIFAVDRFGNETLAAVDVCVDVAGNDGGAPLLDADELTSIVVTSPSSACGRAAGGSRVFVTDTLAEDVVAAVVSAGLPGSAAPDDTVVFTVQAAEGERLTLVATDGLAVACGAEELAVQLVDAFDNRAAAPAAPLLVRLAVNAPTGAPQITATSLLLPTVLPAREVIGALAPSGQATFTVTLDAAGLLEASTQAALPTAGELVSVDFRIGALDPAASTVQALSAEVLSGAGAAPLEVVPRDACGVRLGAGRSVTLTADFGALDAVVDEGDGRYTSAFRAAAGQCPTAPARIGAAVDGVPLDAVAEVAARCSFAGQPALIDRDANLSAALGRPYVYDEDRRIGAAGTPPISYALVSGPPGMVVGQTSGRVDWLPSGAGLVHVEVSASNPAGTDSYAFDIDVAADAPPPPVASFVIVPASGPAPFLTTLDGSGSVPSSGAALLVQRWDFGDGSAAGFGERSAHSYLRAGGYVVRLALADTLGGTATATGSVAVLDGELVPPRARMIASVGGGEDAVVVDFSCDCAAGSAPITSIVWAFGDGASAQGAEVTHSFAPGSWQVHLLVTDGNGLSAQDRTAIAVARGGAQPPQLVVSAAPVAGPAPLSVVFNADAGDLDGSVTSVRWQFSDGASAEGESATRTFAEPGFYLATATAIDDAGLEASASVEVAVTDADGAVPPVIVSLPDLVARVGEEWSYDEDGQPSARGDRALLWSIGKTVAGATFGAPTGMSVAPGSGRLSFVPTLEQRGQVPVVLVVQNSAGLATQEFEIEVVGDVAGGASCGCSSSSNSSSSSSGDPATAALFGAGALLLLSTRARRR